MPRVREQHDIRDDEKNCSCCGSELHRKGEEVTEQLDRPGQNPGYPECAVQIRLSVL
ncbi:IS66 family transposase zinc-finger binding domain-containing protein [Endozoicomonas sp. SESOKO3]|uniref:IS66 family transposase zinc-finger binding domain-containing protein n=1 Tax=Endozoicomonas sp. SESOKO3 TaxID=2828744 RepID=UPI0035A012A1